MERYFHSKVPEWKWYSKRLQTRHSDYHNQNTMLSSLHFLDSFSFVILSWLVVAQNGHSEEATSLWKRVLSYHFKISVYTTARLYEIPLFCFYLATGHFAIRRLNFPGDKGCGTWQHYFFTHKVIKIWLVEVSIQVPSVQSFKPAISLFDHRSLVSLRTHSFESFRSESFQNPEYDTMSKFLRRS